MNSMKKILKLEFIKTLNYPGFKTIIILHAALFVLVVTIAPQFKHPMLKMGLEKLVSFPYVWATFSWVGSWFNILLGILAIILVGNEHQFRMFRKQILDGVSRSQLLYAKMVVMLTLALYALALILLSGIVFGIIYSESISFSGIFDKMPLVFVLFIQSFAYMMLGMLFAFIFKSNAISIVTYILFFFPVEPILRAFFPDSIDKFFPVKIISNLTPLPDFLEIVSKSMIQVNGKAPASLHSMGLLPDSLSVLVSTLVCIGYIVVFYYATKLIVDRRNF
ncbi:MAG: hypothetical protein EHM93_02375 [Bacteroidales bacterium]|nr:MAG: hypothetical protein EHM93_02375 [Bacteroidales bacterium]